MLWSFPPSHSAPAPPRLRITALTHTGSLLLWMEYAVFPVFQALYFNKLLPQILSDWRKTFCSNLDAWLMKICEAHIFLPDSVTVVTQRSLMSFRRLAMKEKPPVTCPYIVYSGPKWMSMIVVPSWTQIICNVQQWLSRHLLATGNVCIRDPCSEWDEPTHLKPSSISS